MNRFKLPLECTVIGVAFLTGWLLSSLADAAGGPARTRPVFSIPIDHARGFLLHEGQLMMFDHSRGILFAADKDFQFQMAESMAGWAVSDVAIVGQTPTYCSRDRVMQVIQGRVVQTPIDTANKLRSIAADAKHIYLLDIEPSPAILTLNARTGQLISRTPYDGHRPTDLAIGHDAMYVLDMGDRCVHRFDLRRGKTLTKIQIGPGVSIGCGGICFFGKQLYVHEADHRRLRPLSWKTHRNGVSSWIPPIQMTFVQESVNVSDDETMLADFDVPVPIQTATQSLGNISWSQEPLQIVNDAFGQPIAQFRDLTLEPKQHHELTYQVDVQPRSMQYDPPTVSLSALNRIPNEIKQRYLADEPVYQMSTNEMLVAAEEARLGANRSQPEDVRTLITNIAWFVSRRIRYAVDHSWDDARTSLMRGSGSCSEYAFVFGSLCRLNRIPTRLVGGIQLGDYAAVHRSDSFHRWTEVYFPDLGWIPVDVTKFDDGHPTRRDFEFLFGTPGYVITLSRGGVDADHLGTTYYIRRRYRGGKRERKNYVQFKPLCTQPTVDLLLQSM